jgi:tRNA dimethylallyltransferase
MNYLITIIGPTAIGKTSLSIALAQHFDCDIVSCDSRQFFKEMKIGTAVPSEEELASATHHFIQNKSIFDNYSVGDFEKEAIAKLDELFLKNNIQIMVGGSGLYVDAVLKGFDDFPDINEEIRNNINADFEKFGIDYLQQKLKELDNDYFQKLTIENPQTLQNPQRMKRFVEVCLGTGKPYSSFIGQKKNNRNFTPIIIGLEAERETMYNRINQRVDIMMNEGLLKEAENLSPNKSLNALQTVGYRELFDYFEGKTTLEFAVEQIKMNTRRFAKRQITWFKRTENVVWFNYLTDIKEIIDTVELIIDNSKIMPISPNFTLFYWKKKKSIFFNVIQTVI